ncbi:MAG: hypothetical protein II956_00720 [Bacteroidales bacterium]|nr:hypothetical protein [Bacteroidales bacterium]
MLEEQLKNEIAVKYFKKFICTDIIKRIDFTVRTAETDYLLWAEAKQQPTDIYKMLAQLLITIKQDAYEINPPKFLGCFDNEKISFIEYYDVLPVFNLNDFNWTQTPSQVDDKTVANVKNTIDKNKIFTFFYDKDEYELKNFIAENFNGSGSLLSTFIDKNNFIFVYQKWRKAVMPFINADWETLKKNYSVYDRDFWLAELNIDDNGTADISDDKTVNEDFYITFSANEKKPYELLRKDGLGMEVSYKFGFKDGGKELYAEFWKLYKRPPKEEIWKYIISRLDLLVPQDVRERKGAFFTPQIWVEKSQEYIADVLGEDWQEEYFVWDCCAGTGNLLNGLKNKYRIFASTLDQQDVDVMKERIKNGANLLESHVFQFDFLNDDFSKCPQSLQDIIFDEEKRKKLVIYINPPYAEAGNAKKVTGTGEHKDGVARNNKVFDKYGNDMGTAANEVYALFLMRIYKELQRCKLCQFAKLKALCASNFVKFRNIFQAKLNKLFVVPADTFDNVKGEFPIGFFIWNTEKKEKFVEITADVFNTKGENIGTKNIIAPLKGKLISDWIRTYYDQKGIAIGYLSMNSTDVQRNKYINISSVISKHDFEKHMFAVISANNLIQISIYLTIRQCITPDWLNDRDQYYYANDGWKNDSEFQTNCLVYTLFHGQNRISCKQGTNHWIPFSESEVNAKEMFQSHFMKDFLDGKIKAEKQNDGLFSDAATVETQNFASLQFTETAKSVMSAGKELWKYYHTKSDANPNASLYDIKEYFQGRNDKGKMNSSSTDPIYTDLLNALKNSLRLLGEEIKPKVYEYGFLR